MDLVEMSLVETDFEQEWSNLVSDLNGDSGFDSAGGIVYHDGFLYAHCQNGSYVSFMHKISLGGSVEESREIISSPSADDIGGNGLTSKNGEQVFYWLSAFDATGYTDIYWYDWDSSSLGSWTVNDPAVSETSPEGIECTFTSFNYLDLVWTDNNGLYLLANVGFSYASDHIRGPYSKTVNGLVHVDGDRGSFNADSVSLFELEEGFDATRLDHCNDNIFIPVSTFGGEE